MDLQTRCLEYLKQEGFSPEIVDDGIIFKYLGNVILVRQYKNDDTYLNLMIPCIYKVVPADKEKYLEVANKVNTRIKTVKITVTENWVNIEIERFVGSSSNLSDFIPNYLHVLLLGQKEFYTHLLQATTNK